MAQTVWTGAVAFGLVHVPVKAVTATRDKSIRFSQLHGVDGEKIHIRRVCPEHGEVPYDELVKGYRLGGEEHVVVTPEELEALEPERTRTIDIEGFVELTEVDPLYFDRSYHLVPAEAAGKAYGLLFDAMEATGRTAIGRFVLRNKEHLVAIRPHDGGLVLETLRFADEVVDVDGAHEGTPERKAPSDREREMAVRLIESLAMPFEPERFKDTFRERVLEMIERKAKGETVQVRPRRSFEPGLEDLAATLEKSLEEISGR